MYPATLPEEAPGRETQTCFVLNLKTENIYVCIRVSMSMCLCIVTAGLKAQSKPNVDGAFDKNNNNDNNNNNDTNKNKSGCIRFCFAVPQHALALTDESR